MVKKFSRALAVLAPMAAVIFAATGAVGAQSQPTYPTEPMHSDSAYYIEVEFSDGTGYDSMLLCPGGGRHPHGAEACTQLTDVNGEVGALTSTDGLCTMDYRPVAVRAHGLWNGEYRSYQGEFGNYCTAVGYTGGHVFDIMPR